MAKKEHVAGLGKAAAKALPQYSSARSEAASIAAEGERVREEEKEEVNVSSWLAPLLEIVGGLAASAAGVPPVAGSETGRALASAIDLGAGSDPEAEAEEYLQGTLTRMPSILMG